jgi:predicted hydrolase (HD superfamily)
MLRSGQGGIHGRPNRSLDEVDPRAVVKKMKDKGFARPVPPDQLLRGAEELGVPLGL